MLAARTLDHGLADFDANAKRGTQGSKHVARITTDVQNIFAGRDNELQRSPEVVVEVAIRSYKLVAIGRDRFLMFPPGIPDFSQRLNPPSSSLSNCRLRSTHTDSSSPTASRHVSRGFALIHSLECCSFTSTVSVIVLLMASIQRRSPKELVSAPSGDSNVESRLRRQLAEQG